MASTSAAASPPSSLAHLRSIGPDVEPLSLDSDAPQHRARAPSFNDKDGPAQSLHLSPVPYSPPRYYAAKFGAAAAGPSPPQSPATRARSATVGALAPTVVFARFRNERPAVLGVRLLETAPTLRHVVTLDDNPVIEVRQRMLARKTLRFIDARTGALIATLRRTKTRQAHGRALLSDPNGNPLAAADWTIAPHVQALDLALSVIAPAAQSPSPLSPESAGSPTSARLPGARARLDIGLQDGSARGTFEGTEVVRFVRRPRLFGVAAGRIEAGADAALVAAGLVAAMYALEESDTGVDEEGDDGPIDKVAAVATRASPGSSRGHMRTHSHGTMQAPSSPNLGGAQVVGLGIGLGVPAAASSSWRLRGKSFSGATRTTGTEPEVPTVVVHHVAGRRSVSGTPGRWEGSELL